MSTGVVPMTETAPPPPVVPLTTKLFFWLILGALSVEFAEVVSASDPFPFFRVWGLTMTCPVYALQVLFLLYFLFGKPRATLPSLFLTGAILGMYEAYITKVLWNPTWGEATFTLKVGGVAVIQTAVLVLFWHPFLAFVLPVFAAENLFTSSRETFEALPPFARRVLGTKEWFLLAVGAFAAYAGIYQSGGIRTLRAALLSGPSTVAFLFLLGGVWRWVRRGRDYSLRELLPSKRQAVVLGVLVLLLYVLTGMFLRPKALPRTLTPHLTVWGMYGVLITLLYFNAKHASPWVPTGRSPVREFSVQAGLLFGALFTATSALFVLLGGNVGIAISIGSWFVGCGAGMALIIWAIFNAFSKPAVDAGRTNKVL